MSDALRNVNPIRDRGACVLVILTNIQAARHCVRGVDEPNNWRGKYLSDAGAM